MILQATLCFQELDGRIRARMTAKAADVACNSNLLIEVQTWAIVNSYISDIFHSWVGSAIEDILSIFIELVRHVVDFVLFHSFQKTALSTFTILQADLWVVTAFLTPLLGLIVRGLQLAHLGDDYLLWWVVRSDSLPPYSDFVAFELRVSPVQAVLLEVEGGIHQISIVLGALVGNW